MHGPVAAVVLVVLAQQLGPFSYVTFLIALSLIYAIGVLGLNIPAGFLGQLSLGQGAALALGAYVAAILATTYHQPIIVTLPAAFVGGLLVGFLMGAPAARLNVLGLGMISLGATLVVGDTISALSITGGPSGIVGILPVLLPNAPPLEMMGVIELVVGFTLLTYVAHWYLRTSNFGRACLAIRSQEIGAAALGINAYWYKAVGFALGTGVGALAGALYSYVVGVISPDAFGVDLSILLLLMVILGGPGTRVGPILGIGIIGILPILLSAYPGLNVVIYGSLLIALVRLLPRGLVARTSAPVIDRGKSHAPLANSRADAFVASGDLPVLQIEAISRRFGGVKALSGVSLQVRRGTVLAVVGPNGSGKTTLLNSIAGFYPPQEGVIRFLGHRINGMAPHKIARLGVARTFQVPKVFTALSVEEHMALARHYGRAGAREELTQLGHDFLGRVGLTGRMGKREVRGLDHGHLRFLEIAMAITRKPNLILMDEPAAGLSSSEMDHLVNLLRELAAIEVPVVIVEHHLDLVRRAADTVAVMHLGKVLWLGEPSRIAESEVVRNAYLNMA